MCIRDSYSGIVISTDPPKKKVNVKVVSMDLKFGTNMSIQDFTKAKLPSLIKSLKTNITQQGLQDITVVLRKGSIIAEVKFLFPEKEAVAATQLKNNLSNKTPNEITTDLKLPTTFPKIKEVKSPILTTETITVPDKDYVDPFPSTVPEKIPTTKPYTNVVKPSVVEQEPKDPDKEPVKENEESLSIGVIIGIFVGVILLLLAIWYFFLRRKKIL